MRQVSFGRKLETGEPCARKRASTCSEGRGWSSWASRTRPLTLLRQDGLSTYVQVCQLISIWSSLNWLNPSRAVLRGTQAFTVLLSLCGGPVQTMSVYRRVSHYSDPQ